MGAIYIYHGYKNGEHVATIEIDKGVAWLRSEALQGFISVHNKVDGAKAAWLRVDGPGTRWKGK